MTTRKSIVTGLVVGAVLLGGGWALRGQGKTSRVDDATHATSFSVDDATHATSFSVDDATHATSFSVDDATHATSFSVDDATHATSFSVDDATHATSFSIVSKDYGFGAGGEQALMARIRSSDSADKRARVSIAALLPGTSRYTKMCGTMAYRSDTDGLYAVSTQPTDGYASGTRVQATFTTFDDVGATASTFTRTVTIP